MSIRTPTRALLIATLAVASIAAAPTPDPVHAAPVPAVDPHPAPPEPSDEPRRVIIELAVDTDLEIDLDAWHEVTEQRTRIHTAQNTIATLITDNGGQITHRYTLSPTLGALLTPDAHTAIATHPLVTGIHDDIPLSLDNVTTPESTHFTGIVEADLTWATGNLGSGQTVAILDTGVDSDHPMFLRADGSSRVVYEACFSSGSAPTTRTLCPNGNSIQTGPGAGADCTGTGSCGHGTHVAGIAAGGSAQYGSTTISGVAPGADIIAIQVFHAHNNANGTTSAYAYSSDIGRALERIYALRNTYDIAAVNLSLGGGKYTSFCGSYYSRAISNLTSAGIAVVIAAGNNGWSNAVGSPGCVRDAITVGSTTVADRISWFSNTASTLIDLYAPGSSIISARNGGGLVTMSGTSMATPAVAGTWALMAAADPTASVATTLTRLRTHGVPIRLRENGTDVGFSHPRIAINSALTDGAEHSLTFTASGVTGTVTATADGADPVTCTGFNATCRITTPTGTTITLTAAAANGYRHTGWTGACATATGPSCTLTLSTATSAAATFTPIPRLTWNVIGPGTVTVSPTVGDPTCTGAANTSCSVEVPGSTPITITATPTDDSVIRAWGGLCSGTATTCTVSVTNSRSFAITFDRVVDITTVASGAGTLTRSNAGIACTPATPGCARYTYNSLLILYANPDPGHATGTWTGPCTGTVGGTCLIRTTSDVTITHTFDPLIDVETFVDGDGQITQSTGTGTCAGTTVGAHGCRAHRVGSTVTLTATPASGWAHTGWSTGPCAGTTTRTCVITLTDNPGRRTPVRATFARQWTLGVGVTGNGAVDVGGHDLRCRRASCGIGIIDGTTVELTAVADPGHTFTGWNGDCTGTTATVCRVTLDRAHDTTAVFRRNPTLTVAQRAGGTLTVADGDTSDGTGIDLECDTDGTCATTHTPGRRLTVSITVDADHHLAGWIGGCLGAEPTCTVTLDDDTHIEPVIRPVPTDGPRIVTTVGTALDSEPIVAMHACATEVTPALPDGLTLTDDGRLTGTATTLQRHRWHRVVTWDGDCAVQPLTATLHTIAVAVAPATPPQRTPLPANEIAELPIRTDIVDRARPRAGERLDLAFPAGTFTPGEWVVLTLHSDPIELGAGLAAADGSFTGTVDVPDGAPAGSHNLVAVGTDSGQALRAPLEIAAVEVPVVEPVADVEPEPVVEPAIEEPTATIPAPAAPAATAEAVPADDISGAFVSGFVPVTPTRLVDTRSSVRVGRVDGSGVALRVPVVGRAGVGADAVAVALNVTVVDGRAADSGGFVTVYPCDVSRPDASNVNFSSGQTVANSVVAPVGSSGDVCVYVYGSAHVLVDISGAITGGFDPTTPTRLLDTRTTERVGLRSGAGTPHRLRVTDASNDTSTGAVALNITVVDGIAGDSGGFVTVYPCDVRRPDASNVNFTSGQTVANSVIAPVSADGTVCLYVYGTAHLLVDVSGHL